MSLHAPDIYVVPPAEDSVAPWCCHNSHSPVADDDDDDESVRFIQASHRTPYFHRSMSGSGSLILPSRKPSSDTQSIVDALGDADDFSDDEIDPGHMHAVPEEDEEDDDLEYEMGVTRPVSPPPPEPYSEVGDDSDIIEVFKLRRQSMRATHTYDDYHGTLGSSTDLNKSSIRFRATKAFRSLRGAVRPSPTFSDTKDSGNTIAPSLRSTSRLRPKLKLKPRAQDVFTPTENVPRPEKIYTHEVPSRSSSRLAQIFPPRLRQRPSNISFTGSSSDLGAQSPSNRTSETLPIVSSVFRREPIPSFAPSRRSSSSTRTQQASQPHSTSKSYSTQNPHVASRNSSTPAISQTLPRSFSSKSVSRSISPVPSASQSSGRFSIRRLHRIFRKTSISNTNSDNSSRVDDAPSIDSSHSTCPSLSSTRTSECSGRTTPTLDTVPQTPTSFDENETRRTIVPLPSSSTVGSGISLGSSLNSGAVSSLSSSNTASSVSTTATRGSVFSAPVFRPRSATCSQSSSQASMGSLTHSVSVSDSTTKCSSSATTAGTSNDPIPSSLLSSPFSEIKLTNLDLQLGQGIDLFSNAANSSSVRSGRSRKATSTSRSLSLKNFSSRLRKGRTPIPLMRSSSSTESDMEMKLDSFHFDDMSFDVDRFMAH